MKTEIETLKLIPENRKFEIKRNNKTVEIRYLRTGRGGKNSNWIVVPKTVPITPEIAVAVGIYYAEGNKSRKR